MSNEIILTTNILTRNIKHSKSALLLYMCMQNTTDKYYTRVHISATSLYYIHYASADQNSKWTQGLHCFGKNVKKKLVTIINVVLN